MENRESGFKWSFHRMGGLEQVEFNRGEDIRRLRELDPKLWVALSCPARGLEFDARTLALIDTDKDGRIRIPEVLDAAEWLCARLEDCGAALNPGNALPVALIDDSTDAGRRLAGTARAILANLGKKDADAVTQDDATQAVLHAAEQIFNGDGVLPPLPELGEDMAGYIRDAISVSGGVDDAGGQVGVNVEISAAFIKSLEEWDAWNARIAGAETPFGKNTPECWLLYDELRNKIDDYFMRCELAAYAPTAQDALNLEDKPLTDETGLLEHAALAGLPLSKAGPDRPLDLRSGLNPAWREKVETFAGLAKPLLSRPDQLTRDDWRRIGEALAPYADAVKEKPVPVVPGSADVKPTQPVEALGEERIRELLDGDMHTRLVALAGKDADGPAASTDIADMERLVLYYLHFGRLLRNFVNFMDFYGEGTRAAFQSGSLFIDGRSCHLCTPVENVEEHAEIAKSSQMFLLYCECSRGPRADGAEKKMNVVAAMTAGDSDFLTVNRNGVFVDNRGNDWDARVVKIVPNPIGLWQAVWSPYKRFGNLVTEQIGKYANQKQTDLMASAGTKLEEAGAKVAAGTAPRFDIGRNVGMFAAVGLALGAIGTAVGSIANALLSMSWWQLPMLLAGLFVIISGPSVLMAWLKLRRRTLGPLLEASGWAINGRANLSYGVAKRMSSLATLPSNSRRSRLEYAVRMKRLRRTVFWVAVGVGVLLGVAWIVVGRYREELSARGKEGFVESVGALLDDAAEKAREAAKEAADAAAEVGEASKEEQPPADAAAP